MVAKKKASAKKKTIGQEKPKKEKHAPKKISLDHEFSFNLLTEPWLPVVTTKAQKKLLSLNEFLKSAHELERFDFPLPGLETAVIRFLVAIIYIVGAPKDKKEWEEWYNAGKFSDSFTKELQTYKDKLDLFSKTEPFMQEVSLKDSLEIELDGIYRLIHYFPYDTNQTHWMHRFSSKENKEGVLSPVSLAWGLLLYNASAYSGGSGYKPGINGKPPNYVLLNGESLFFTLLFNLHYDRFILDLAENKKNIKINSIGFPTKIKGEVLASNINLQTGLLWNSRQLLFIPEANKDNEKCSITSTTSTIIIKGFIMKPQSMSLKKGQYWSDPHVVRIDLGSKGQKNLNESGTLPIWRDYPSLLLTAGFKDEKRKANIFPPLNVQQISQFRNLKNNFRIQLFSFSTVNNAKINQIKEEKYFFSPRFIDNEDIIPKIQLIIRLTDTFSYLIKQSLKIAFDIKKGSNQAPPDFQSAFWYELNSAFEASLSRLSGNEDSNQVLQDWKKMLASHVRNTFKRHTTKLISNPKNLKAYELGRKNLEGKIYKELLPKEKK
jgi:CRISPR type I-E-associated protein CasA/Cse1